MQPLKRSWKEKLSQMPMAAAGAVAMGQVTAAILSAAEIHVKASPKQFFDRFSKQFSKMFGITLVSI